MKNRIKKIVFVLGIIILDQITKFIAIDKLKPVGNIPLIDGILSLTYVENTGAAFGLLKGAMWIFIPMTFIILLIIYYYYKKLPASDAYPFNLIRIALLLITGGALGNFIDRIINGYVVDFIHITFIDFPVFNFADIYVVIGAISLAFLLLFAVKEDDELV